MSEKCEKLHSWFNSQKRHNFPFDEKEIPFNGVYVLFEKGELAHGANRIVRIGTHTGDKQLRSRLKQHFIKENKDRSIFRKNIGRALLTKDKDPFLEYWELDLTSRKAKDKYRGLIDLEKQKEVEKKTTECIRENFSFVVFQVSNKEKRLAIESKIISTVSLCDECKPSGDWLGLYSTKQKIRESGLWLINELYKDPFSDKDIKVLGELLERG